MNIVVISQARMASTRLPGKVLKPILGRPLIAYHLERVRQARRADALCVATTTNPQDDLLAAYCRKTNISCFRGPEDDVLARYAGAAEFMKADVIVRVTSDCPLIDARIIDQVVAYYLVHANEYDYVSNVVTRTFPRGMDTEVFPRRLLEEARREAQLPSEREHVTPFIYGHPERYRLGQVTYPRDESAHRWTVDTLDDFDLVRRIIEKLYPSGSDFSMDDILALIARQPDWKLLNSHVQQKA